MKTFKTFLFEEMAVANTSISEVPLQTTDTSKNLNFTPPTGVSNNTMNTVGKVNTPKPIKPTGKVSTPKPINKSSDDDDDGDNELLQDFDEWLRDYPMPDPSDYDADGDGRVDPDKRSEYDRVWRTWRDHYLRWLFNQHSESNPSNDGPTDTPGQFQWQTDRWERESRDIDQERFPNQHEPPRPPDMSEEDYQFWKKAFRYNDPRALPIFDYIWRYYRAGQPGFPNVRSPIGPDGVEPIFPVRNLPPGVHQA